MPKQKQQSSVNPDFVKPIILAGVFLIIYAIINGFFTLANTRIIHPSPSAVPALETVFVSTELIEMRAKVHVDAHEAWQNTNIFVEKGTTVQVKVLDGEWTEWDGVRGDNSGNGSGYICAKTMKSENCIEPVPDFPSGALIGRIDRQTLKIGFGGTFTADHSGVLQLRMNDADTGLYDNNGVLTVEVVLNKGK
ncbi:MAG: hypothetical protein IPP66_09980 [Anaerolineales bacterium]|nr:hypothetical protein [Anaerolineales bacterium]